MKVMINFSIEVDRLSDAIDRLQKLRETVLPSFNSAYEELSLELDEDNFGLTEHHDDFVMEIEL